MNIAVILAAGVGSRMKNAGSPKQLIYLNDKPLLIHVLSVFSSHPDIHGIVIVSLSESISLIGKWVEEYKISKIHSIVAGGSTRQESSYLGVKAAATFAKNDDIILIHDAARVLINEEIISENISGVVKHDAVVTAMPVKDTIIQSETGALLDSVTDRSKLYTCQTPQSFRLKLILAAHESAHAKKIANATDDAQLVKANGRKVFLVSGNSMNFKVTTNDDLFILKSLMKK